MILNWKSSSAPLSWKNVPEDTRVFMGGLGYSCLWKNDFGKLDSCIHLRGNRNSKLGTFPPKYLHFKDVSFKICRCSMADFGSHEQWMFKPRPCINLLIPHYDLLVQHLEMR